MPEATPPHDYRRELDDINHSRFRQIAKSESSLDIAAEDFMHRFGEKIQRLHIVDLFTPSALISIFLKLVVVSIIMNKVLDLESKVGISGSIAALGIATLSSIGGAHRSRHYQRQLRSTEYIKTWTTGPIARHVYILVYLAHTWEKEKVAPKVPAICIRPLVLTENDLTMADKLQEGTIKNQKSSAVANTCDHIIF